MIGKITALHRAWDPAKFGFIDDIVPKYGDWLKERAKDPQSVFLVALERDRLVAFLIATIEQAAPIYRPSEYGLIRDLWVEQGHRRAGLGRSMTQAAIARFAELGVKQVRLEIAAANEPARRFFASCGFRPSATEMLLE
jgi:ribosomal protein S18 acetylase RimI-like enzyme